ncbi:hypothetical protein GEMRC1_003198 [Eukaryota sp. GEM-RC1]
MSSLSERIPTLQTSAPRRSTRVASQQQRNQNAPAQSGTVGTRGGRNRRQLQTQASSIVSRKAKQAARRSGAAVSPQTLEATRKELKKPNWKPPTSKDAARVSSTLKQQDKPGSTKGRGNKTRGVSVKKHRMSTRKNFRRQSTPTEKSTEELNKEMQEFMGIS